MAGPTHAAFLRGVNLGATRKAPAEKLRSAFEDIGLGDVATFRNSGNVVFSAKGSAGKLRARIEEELAAALGFDVAVLVRTEARLRAIGKHKPFPAKALDASKGKLQVALLEKAPAAAAVKRITELAGTEDRVAVDGTELYWLPAGGTQSSPLGMKAIDDAVGLNTIRTMGTIEQIVAKFFDQPPPVVR